MTNENLNPNPDSQSQRRFPSRRELAAQQRAGQPVEESSREDSSAPELDPVVDPSLPAEMQTPEVSQVESPQPAATSVPPVAPRYGVKMDEKQLAEFRRQQGLPPVGEQPAPQTPAQGGWDESKGRFRRPGESAPSSSAPRPEQPKNVSANPYAPASQSFEQVTKQSPQSQSTSSGPLPSRKGPIWTLVVSVFVLLALPIGLIIYTTAQLMGASPTGSEIGQMRQVAVGEQFPVREGEKAWAVIQGIDDSSTCALYPGASTSDSEAMIGEPIGLETTGQQIRTYPAMPEKTATMRCEGAKPSAILMGTGDFEAWSFNYSRVLLISMIFGLVAFVGMIVGIVWLVKVNGRRKTMRN
ncbi:hypothetical protein [Boudabousia marimammalium]|uniref:Uncharacterized protein n=1 Tax=Boudabousia marimammalium TaxID=156892 RepID=A0A1Q5PKH7_9ACTO|nr:hypothetical protein [Boudabousia marimammalium]OKL46725.1 hypothetical protein BM477_07175 [Boudabousia marimammalium]